MSFKQTKVYKEIIDLIKIKSFDKAKEIFNNNQKQYQNDASFFSLLGYFYDFSNNYTEAKKYYLEAISLDPEIFDAQLNLAILYLKVRDFNSSEIIFKHLSKKKENCLVYYNLGLLQFEKKNYTEAILSFKKAIFQEPNFFPAQHHLAMTYEVIGNYSLAIDIYQKLIKNNIGRFNLGIIYNNIGNVYFNIKNFNLAYNYFLKALNCLSEKGSVYNNLGYLCFQIGYLEKSILYFKRATKEDETNFNYHSRFIATSLYSYNHKDLYNEHTKKFNLALEKLKSNKKNQYVSVFDLEKFKNKLRIGFLSSDFKRHPVSYYLLDHLDELKKYDLELHGYCNLEEKFYDDYTIKISKKFNFWNNIKFLNDIDLVSKIKKDKINILIDLSGHSGDNRINVFALKPAPIQINWAGYLASTGIKEIDYILGDKIVTPKSHQDKYSESILQFKKLWACLSVSDLKSLKFADNTPAINNKYITFGSLANANKINKKVLNTWLRILKHVPNSKLFLKSFEFKIQSHIERVKFFFLNNNIEKSRIILEEPSDRPETLNAYNNIDIVLDTFPYSGGTTNFEASWMCVPILTLKGDNFISKCGESINLNLNMEEWIAEDIEDYINKCILFSKDLNLLNKIKKKLIFNSRNSDLFNSENFSKDFSEILKMVWKNFVNNSNL